MILGAILKDILSSGTKSNDTKVMRPRSRNDAARDNRSRDMIDTLRRNNERSNNARKGAVGASRGPTVAQQVAARAAEKLKAKKAKGQSRRKKYEAAETMAKKMKLIFVD